MKKLQLSLFKEHFDKTKAGIKKEDYRKLDAYFFSRFILVNGKQQKQKWWDGHYLLFFMDNQMKDIVNARISTGEWSFIKFDINRMTLGYPSKEDKSRILELEHKGIEIREGNPDWGAKPGILYFCIMHGNILEQ